MDPFKELVSSMETADAVFQDIFQEKLKKTGPDTYQFWTGALYETMMSQQANFRKFKRTKDVSVLKRIVENITSVVSPNDSSYKENESNSINILQDTPKKKRITKTSGRTAARQKTKNTTPDISPVVEVKQERFSQDESVFQPPPQAPVIIKTEAETMPPPTARPVRNTRTKKTIKSENSSSGIRQSSRVKKESTIKKSNLGRDSDVICLPKVIPVVNLVDDSDGENATGKRATRAKKRSDCEESTEVISNKGRLANNENDVKKNNMRINEDECEEKLEVKKAKPDRKLKSVKNDRKKSNGFEDNNEINNIESSEEENENEIGKSSEDECPVMKKEIRKKSDNKSAEEESDNNNDDILGEKTKENIIEHEKSKRINSKQKNIVEELSDEDYNEDDEIEINKTKNSKNAKLNKTKTNKNIKPDNQEVYEQEGEVNNSKTRTTRTKKAKANKTAKLVINEDDENLYETTPKENNSENNENFNEIKQLSVADKEKEQQLPNMNSTMVINKIDEKQPMMDGTFVIDKHQQVVNATIIMDKQSPQVMNSTITVDKQSHNVMDTTVVLDKKKKVVPEVKRTSGSSVYEDAVESINSTTENAKKMGTIKKNNVASKDVLDTFTNSPVKKMVEVFEKLGAASNEEVPTRMTRTKTRNKAKAQGDQETEKKTSMIPISKSTTPSMENRYLPSFTSTKISRSQQPPVTQAKTMSALKASQQEFREREQRRREKEEDAQRKKELLLRAQMEEKKKKREERELKARQLREAQEKEKVRALEIQALKEERLKQIQMEKQQLLIKQKEEAEKKRQLVKQRAELKRKEEEEMRKKQEEEQLLKKLEEGEKRMRRYIEASEKREKEVEPIYKRIKAPLLPTYDCYDSDVDEETKKKYPSIPRPKWSRTEELNRALKYMQFVDSSLQNTVFYPKPQTPDLIEVFQTIDPKKLKRNSSAIWKHPPRFTLMPVIQSDDNL